MKSKERSGIVSLILAVAGIRTKLAPRLPKASQLLRLLHSQGFFPRIHLCPVSVADLEGVSVAERA